MLTSTTTQIIRATIPALNIYNNNITKRMYELLFQDHPELRAMFDTQRVQTGMQARILADAIYKYAINIENPGVLMPAVSQIANKHVSTGVSPEYYPIVGKYLIQAIKDVLGPIATDEVANAWTEAYQFLADVFIQKESDLLLEKV